MTRRDAAEYLRVSVDTIDRRLTPDVDQAVTGRFRFRRMPWDTGFSPIRIRAEDVYAVLPPPPPEEVEVGK
jgi:hypothetical protein